MFKSLGLWTRTILTVDKSRKTVDKMSQKQMYHSYALDQEAPDSFRDAAASRIKISMLPSKTHIRCHSLTYAFNNVEPSGHAYSFFCVSYTQTHMYSKNIGISLIMA